MIEFDKNVMRHSSLYTSTHDGKFVITGNLSNTAEQNIKIFHLDNLRCEVIIETRVLKRFTHMPCLISLQFYFYFTIKPVLIFTQTVCQQFATRCLLAPVASWSLLFSRSYYWAWKLSQCMKPLTSARISTGTRHHDTLWERSATKHLLLRQYCDDFRKLKDAIDFYLRSFVEEKP